jgi:enoyl-CoA hydratase/carnithine racemase
MSAEAPATLVRYELADGVATITLDDPGRRHALSRALRDQLWAAMRRLAAERDARAAILTATGEKTFCAGADLHEFSVETVGPVEPDYVPVAGRNLDLPMPLIAAVNGAALGGGFLLMLSADLVVAADHAIFGMPEARWGRGAPWSIPLARMVSERVWMELCLTGEPIDARRALAVGIVNRVVPAAELAEVATALARRIAANAPLTVAASRRMIRLAAEAGRTAAWNEADELFVPVYESEDAREGPRAFHERREPRWSGR